MIYIYPWKNNFKRAGFYGRPCQVIVRGPRESNSALIEFLDTHERTVTSRNALRKSA